MQRRIKTIEIADFFLILGCASSIYGATPHPDDWYEGRGTIWGWIVLIVAALVLYIISLPIFFLWLAFRFRHQRAQSSNYFASCYRVAKQNTKMFLMLSPFLIIFVLVCFAILNLPLLAFGINKSSWLFASIPVGLLISAIAVSRRAGFTATDVL